MKDLISSVFSHEIKNSLSSIKFGIEMFDKYEMDKDEKKELIKDLLKNTTNTILILEEYLNFIKFQFTKKLNYEKINLFELLEEIKLELLPFAKDKCVNIYLQKSDYKILNNRFWLKRAIYNIFFNAIKYNKKSGTVNIKIETNMLGIYLSISDTGIGIDRKKIKTVFQVFERIDETQRGFGIGLALSKSVIDSMGGTINVKSNKNIGSDFILYIPNTPKEITFQRIAKGLLPASIVLFLGISYFPIYSQNYTISNNGGYISYKLEDGSVLKFSQNSKYTLSLNKNLYNSKYTMSTTIFDGDMSLKAIKTKANINVNENNFRNLGTDFEILKDDNIKVAVFGGKVVGANEVLSKKDGLIISNDGKIKVKLLDKVKDIKINNNILSFYGNPKAVKYQILFSKQQNFSIIENSFFTTKIDVKLKLNNDTLYYIKVFAYDKNGLPSIPNNIKYINLSHYKLALNFIKNNNYSEAMLELENSISTIQNYSSLPYFELSKVYFKEKDYKQSLFYINRAITINKNIIYFKFLADIYIKLQKFNKMEKIIDKLLKIYPNDIDLLYYKSLILKTKNPKEAQKYLFKLLQINPNYKKANLLMSEIMEKLNKKSLSKYYKEMAQ